MEAPVATKHRFKLEAGEGLLNQWVAGVPGKSGKRTKWGGHLYLTDRRVVWEVFRFSRSPVFGLSSYGLILSPADVVIGGILGKKGSMTIPLREVTGVRPDEERGAVLWVDTEHGGMRLLTTASKWGYNRARDTAVRDQAVSQIRRACGLEG
jgi:hypothetical protein